MTEKYIVFGPIILFFAFFILLILGFLFLVFRLLKKSRNSYWIGTIIDKKMFSKRDFDSNKIENYYTIIVKTDQGREIKIGVSAEDYKSKYEIGGKLEKRKGEFHPKKI